MTVNQPVKKFPTFFGTRRFMTVFTKARHWTVIMRHMNPIHTLIYYSFRNCFIIVLPSTLVPPKWSFLFMFSDKN
jgi:hypothetical protein